MHRRVAFFSTIIALILSEFFFYFYLSSEINTHLIYQTIYFGSIVLFVGTFYNAFTVGRIESENITRYTSNFLFGLAFTLFITKLTFVVVSVLGEGVYFITTLLGIERSTGKRELIKIIAGAVSSIPFFSFLYGITKGKYNYKVIHVPLYFTDLPKEFEGYKVVQISDIHSGSFDSKKQVQKGINLINKQEADLVLFTGDLVNNYASEIKPFIPIFKQIEAKDGKYSITGNHDYADYVRWESKDAKQANFNQLLKYHGEMDFNILMNEHIKVKRENNEIAIIGIENWGMPPFPQFGDLNKATENLDNKTFKILLSHDPSHWDAEVVDAPMHFNLTLSGHTHGMQFGFDIRYIIKWSPVKYKYPRWAGLYERKDQFLYVNKGFGFLGFPGRVGMWPEITVFELKHKKL